MITIPETQEDVNKLVFTNLNLADNKSFQLLHNDVKNDFRYQLLGRFEAERNGENFKIKQIDFKIIYINFPEGSSYYKIRRVEIELPENSDYGAEIYIYIEGTDEEKTGIDYTYNRVFEINSNKSLIDYHIRDLDGETVNRFGNPCKTLAYYQLKG
ncbi:hypothetical protein [Kordia sp.]|uniref:hypothetical protein n=1 Tax=Kordia sp. TaxID=1965332 RepID=UPI003D6A4D01